MAKKYLPKWLAIVLLIILSVIALGWILGLLNFIISIIGIGSNFSGFELGYILGIVAVGYLVYKGIRYSINSIKNKA